MKDAESALQSLYVILRCNRWGAWVRWRANPGGLSDPTPARVRSWWFQVVMVDKVQQLENTGRRGLCPVDMLEAEETHRCIDALPDHLRDTIVEEYAVGGSAYQKAEALGIDTRTFRHRRCLAHVELLGLFNDAACGVRLVKRDTGLRGGPRPIARPAAA